jgi:hypothetical protein
MARYRGSGSPCLGANPTDASNQIPQLQPPPASGDNTIPSAGNVLTQQSGRSLAQPESFEVVGDHAETLVFRKKNISVEHEYVPHLP